MMMEMSSGKFCSACTGLLSTSIVWLIIEFTLWVQLMKLNIVYYLFRSQTFLGAYFLYEYFAEKLLLLLDALLNGLTFPIMRLARTSSFLLFQCFQQLIRLSFSLSFFSKLGSISQQYSPQNCIFLYAGTLHNSLKFSLQNSTYTLLICSSFCICLQASCKIAYYFLLLTISATSLAFYSLMLRFSLLSWVNIILRVLIWLGVCRTLLVDRCLYFMSYLVSSSSSLFFACCFFVVFSLLHYCSNISLKPLKSSFFSSASSYFLIRALFFSISSSLMELRKASCEFSTVTRSIMSLSSFIQLKYMRLTLVVAPYGYSFYQ